MFGARQSLSLVHAARQAVAPLQTYGAHGRVDAGRQVPRPSHMRPLICVDWPVGHDGGAHDVAASYRWHAPLPSQRPSVPQLVGPMSGQRVSMSPGATLEHVPRDAVSAHDLQTPSHLVRQQTPCSQKPSRHSSGPKHVAPGGLRPQVPFTQDAGGLQSVSAVHDALHALVPHLYGKQSAIGGVTHVPTPLHVDSAVNRWVVVGQVAGRHGVPAT
jgi:hypothetical protein